MMEGRTIDELIYKRDQPSLTENDVVAYVRQSHPNYQFLLGSHSVLSVHGQ